MGAGFLEFCWCEANSDFFGGEIKVRASNGSANAFTGFSNGLTGHTDDVKTG